MGIPKFFRWISERYPLCSDSINENRVPDFDCLYLDMNGVIHQCSHSSDEKLITSRDESEIFLAVFAYVQALFDKIRPSKLFFLAVDGVAPRAKMNQQRSRRFRTAAEKAEAEAKEAKKEQAELAKVLNDPKAAVTKTPVKYFDTNCITPGTEFMEKLTTHLCYFIAKRIEEDANWRDVKIVFSGPEVPGEGEHKVMEWIRSERARSDYEPNLRHCLYGLDADLIMLGLLSHEPHFSLLREEVTFGRGKKNAGVKSAEQTRFQLLHLGLMRDYMQNEFGGTLAASLPFEYDFERILDDFVLLSLFVGNDFLPHLPHLHINENALGLLFDAYKSTLPHLDGYLNDCGKINLQRCAEVLKNVVEFERQVFESECADELMAVSTKASKPASNVSSSLPPITPKQRKLFDEFVSKFLKNDSATFWECDPELIANHPEDRVFVAGLAKDFMLILEFTEDHSFVIRKCFEDEEEEFVDPDNMEDKWKFTLDTAKIVSKYEKRPILSELDPTQLATAIVKHEEVIWQSWKAQYYAEKMEIRETEPRNALMQKYCEGLEWVMAYYYEGVASWSWFFNYHYAPFLSDLIEFLQGGLYEPIKFELGRPFAPFEQLMGVLPSLSGALVPAPLAALMTSPESPILHFFPTEFESDLNGKKNSWEAVVKIPFIDEHLLVKTLESKYVLLTETELRRNRFGDSYTFEYCKLGTAGTHWSSPSASFEPLEESRVKLVVQVIGKPERKDLRKGLVPGTLLGLEGPPSFPSLKTLPHSSALQHLNVQVFPGQPSKAMTLALVVTDEHVRNYSAAPARAFEHENVYMNWPHLLEAQLIAVTDGQRVYTRESTMELTPQLLQKYAGPGIQDFNQLAGNIEETYTRKEGILLAGGVSMLAVLNPFKRLKLGADGAIVKEFDESRVEIVPLQLLVFNLPRVDSRFQGRAAFASDPVKLVAETFQIGDEIIYAGPLGVSVGRVDGFVQEGRALSIRVDENMAINTAEHGKIVKASLNRVSESFYDAKQVAEQLKIPMSLLSKLTSTLQIMHQNKNVVNVGFGIKFEGKSRAVAELARRSDGPGRWEYSRKFVDHLDEYVRNFPELISALVKCGPSADRPNLESAVSAAKIEEIKAWLKSHGYPIGSEAAQPCDRVQMLDLQGVTELAQSLDTSKLQSALNLGKESRKLSPCKPEHLLTRKTAQLYAIQQNELRGASQFSVGDRVLWCGDGADGIPFGCPGTILAIFADVPNKPNYNNNNNSQNNNAPSSTFWFLSDQNLRGIGSDLGGFLPAALKHRGIQTGPSKLILNKQTVSSVHKSVDKRVNSMKFNTAADKNAPVKVEEKKTVIVGGGNAQKPNGMDLLQKMFEGATLGANANKNPTAVQTKPTETHSKNFAAKPVDTKIAAAKPATIKITTAKASEPVVIHTTTAASSSHGSNPVIKKKPVVTSGTAKISYSTKTKTTQTQ